MRYRSEVWLIVAVSLFSLIGAFAWSAMRMENAISDSPGTTGLTADPDPVTTAAASGVEWFQDMRPYCNAVDVETRVRWTPPPASIDGDTYRAACYALAGRTDRARELIGGLPADHRWQAAGTVFDIGHPAADAGDELAAGPLMELVVEFWPNHYMALYHAGAAAFERSDLEKAEDYLTRFLAEYAVEDGWRTNARGMLDRIQG